MANTTGFVGVQHGGNPSGSGGGGNASDAAPFPVVAPIPAPSSSNPAVPADTTSLATGKSPAQQQQAAAAQGQATGKAPTGQTGQLGNPGNIVGNPYGTSMDQFIDNRRNWDPSMADWTRPYVVVPGGAGTGNGGNSGGSGGNGSGGNGSGGSSGNGNGNWSGAAPGGGSNDWGYGPGVLPGYQDQGADGGGGIPGVGPGYGIPLEDTYTPTWGYNDSNDPTGTIRDAIAGNGQGMEGGAGLPGAAPGYGIPLEEVPEDGVAYWSEPGGTMTELSDHNFPTNGGSTYWNPALGPVYHIYGDNGDPARGGIGLANGGYVPPAAKGGSK